MMTKRRLLMLLIAAVFGILAALPTTKVAAATCYGSGCNGLNAISTGCSTGAYQVSQTDIYDLSSNYIGGVELWWSPTCQTAWSYVYSDFRAYRVEASVTSTSPSNLYTQDNFHVYTARSPMVYATNVSYTTACGRIDDVGISGSACTP